MATGVAPSNTGSRLVTVDERINKMKYLLEKRKFEDLNREVLDPGNAETLLNNGWDIVPLVCSLATDRSYVEACANTIKNLAKVGNPKELLVALLEQMDLLDADLKFQLLLGSIQTVLLRLPTARSMQSLRWVLGALHQHIMKNLPVPKSKYLEGKAKMLEDSDPDVMIIEDAIRDLIQFCEPFLRELATEKEEKNTCVKRKLLSGFLVEMLHPLAFVDISASEETPKGTLRVYSERIISDVNQLESNLYKIYNGVQVSPSSDIFDGDISLQALGVLLYMIHVEGYQKECLPCIYSHRHTLEASLPAILTLLNGIPNEHKIVKGLQLTDQLLKFIRNYDFGPKFLDSPSITDLALCLERVAVFEKSTETRRLAIKLLPLLIDKFTKEGRYKFVYTLLNTIRHSGVKGIIIGTIKGHVNEVLNSEEEQIKSSPFIGASLLKMLKAMTTLPHSIETDLMEDSERILAAINFLRFLFLKDEINKNITGIWDMRDMFRCDFFNIVLKAVDISRAHYQLELKHQSEGSKKKGKGSKASTMVSVEGINLPPMPINQTIQCLNSALCRLDMIQSVIIRVLEIIDGRK